MYMTRRLSVRDFISWDKGFVDILRQQFFQISLSFDQGQVFKEITQIGVGLQIIEMSYFNEGWILRSKAGHKVIIVLGLLPLFKPYIYLGVQP